MTTQKLEYPIQMNTQKFSLSSSTGSDTCLIIHNGEVKTIDSNQRWFWTEEWQKGEREVDELIQRGEFETFDSMEEFINSLQI